jgi:hypothetical protein
MEANKALQSEIDDREFIEGSLRESEERYRTVINSIEDGYYEVDLSGNTQFYSTRRPFDFNAGGKGLELMRLKLFAADGAFDLSFESKRCKYIPADSDCCCGRISSCRAVSSVKDCIDSGGRFFPCSFSKGPLTR